MNLADVKEMAYADKLEQSDFVEIKKDEPPYELRGSSYFTQDKGECGSIYFYRDFYDFDYEYFKTNYDDLDKSTFYCNYKKHLLVYPQSFNYLDVLRRFFYDALGIKVRSYKLEDIEAIKFMHKHTGTRNRLFHLTEYEYRNKRITELDINFGEVLFTYSGWGYGVMVREMEQSEIAEKIKDGIFLGYYNMNKRFLLNMSRDWEVEAINLGFIRRAGLHNVNTATKRIDRIIKLLKMGD